MPGGALREIIASFGTSFDAAGIKQGDAAIAGMIGKLKRFATEAAAAFAIKEVLGFTMGLAEQAVELEHHAEALGISAQSLQKWDFAASLSGVSAEELQIGLQKLQRSAVGAGGKGGDLGATFEKLHVTVKNANGSFKNADELLTDVAGAIGDMTDPTLQTATAMQIFGRGGARLLPFLKQGRAGVAGLKAEVEALGGGFTDDFIEKSKAMVQDSKRLEFAFLGLKVKAIGPLLPLLTKMAEGATKFAVSFGDVMKKSNVAKAALIALGVGGTIALAPLLLSIAPLVAGFLLLEDVLTFLTGGDSLTGDLVDKFFGKGAGAKVQAFANALSNDVGPMLHDIIGIFTDGKPLSEKFRELDTYIAGVLGPQFRKDFGEMADSVTTVIEVAASLAETLHDIIDGMKWIAANTVGLALDSAVKTQDAQANSDAKKDAAEKAGTFDWKTQFNGRTLPARDESASWFDQLKQQIGIGKDAPAADLKQLVPDAKQLAAQNVATAPVGAEAYRQPDLSQQISAPITQQFYGMENDKDVGRAAAKGAEAGLKSGGNDRAQRALVPLSGS